MMQLGFGEEDYGEPSICLDDGDSDSYGEMESMELEQESMEEGQESLEHEQSLDQDGELKIDSSGFNLNQFAFNHMGFDQMMKTGGRCPFGFDNQTDLYANQSHPFGNQSHPFGGNQTDSYDNEMINRNQSMFNRKAANNQSAFNDMMHDELPINSTASRGDAK